MATQRQISRRERALASTMKRQDFWESLSHNDTVVIDGKECDPEEKQAQARQEEVNLRQKLGIRKTVDITEE